MTLERAKLEFERRYCSNSTENINESDIRITNAAALAFMLDLRTCNTAVAKLKGFEFPAHSLKELGSMLKQEYVDLFVAAKQKSFAARMAAAAAAKIDTVAQAIPSVPTFDDFGFEVIVPTEPCEVMLPEPPVDVLQNDAEKDFMQCWARWKQLSAQVQAKMVTSFENEGTFGALASEANEGAALVFSKNLACLWAKIRFGCATEYQIAESSPDKYGFFPMLVRKYCGRLLSESFCERVLSVANLVVTKRNVRLATEDVESTVLLRMNSRLITEMFKGAGTSADMLSRMAAVNDQITPAVAKKPKIDLGWP